MLWVSAPARGGGPYIIILDGYIVFKSWLLPLMLQVKYAAQENQENISNVVI